MIERMLKSSWNTTRNFFHYISYKAACLKEKKLRHNPDWVLDKGPCGYSKVGPVTEWLVNHAKSLSLSELEAMS